MLFSGRKLASDLHAPAREYLLLQSVLFICGGRGCMRLYFESENVIERGWFSSGPERFSSCRHVLMESRGLEQCLNSFEPVSCVLKQRCYLLGGYSWKNELYCKWKRTITGPRKRKWRIKNKHKREWTNLPEKSFWEIAHCIKCLSCNHEELSSNLMVSHRLIWWPAGNPITWEP